jgi:hypothetical protein
MGMRHRKGRHHEYASDTELADVSFREFALAPRPHGLNIPPKAYKGFMADVHKAVQEIAEDAEAHTLNVHGGMREQVDHIKLTGGGTSADYLARRIARDRPDILERMRAGEYKSVWQAAEEGRCDVG